MRHTERWNYIVLLSGPRCVIIPRFQTAEVKRKATLYHLLADSLFPPPTSPVIRLRPLMLPTCASCPSPFPQSSAPVWLLLHWAHRSDLCLLRLLLLLLLSLRLLSDRLITFCSHWAESLVFGTSTCVRPAALESLCFLHFFFVTDSEIWFSEETLKVWGQISFALLKLFIFSQEKPSNWYVGLLLILLLSISALF